MHIKKALRVSLGFVLGLSAAGAAASSDSIGTDYFKSNRLASSCQDLFQSQVQSRFTRDSVEQIFIRSGIYFMNYPEFDYSNHQRLLFLSDGGKVLQNGGIKDSFHNLWRDEASDRLVVSADFDASLPSDIRMSNRALPFAENSFDFILMNRGLCFCKSDLSCGGLPPERAEMKKFLLDIVYTLDKKRSGSLAILTGFVFATEQSMKVPQMWKDVLLEVSQSHPNLKFAWLRSSMAAGKREDFLGLVISTDRLTPLSFQLQRLSPELR